MPIYQDVLQQLRHGFPAPESDPVHDGYVAFSVLRALDRVDALKSKGPLLGAPTDPNYIAAAQARLADSGRTLEEVIPLLVDFLQGMHIWGHPRSQVNVATNPSIASLIGMLLPAMFNPNLCSDESGRRFSEAEVRAIAMSAALVGYDPNQASGIFTFGGTGTLLYGVKIGLEKALPGSLQHGLRGGGAVILASGQSHYACLNVAGWLGLGHDCVRKVPTSADNAVIVEQLETAANEALAAGEKIAAIVATMGTTDAFGVDDLAAIVELRQRLVQRHKLDYSPHIHADAVIGWAWSVFNDYDFDDNPLEFRGRTLRALAAATRRIRHLGQADSVGIDFHKTGYAPYVSSLFLTRDSGDFNALMRTRATMPYLFNSGELHPAMYSLETTRSATGVMAALANLLLLGKQGLRVLIGNAVEMAELFREFVSAKPDLSVLNDQNFGPVTLFRAYPPGIDTFQAKAREQSDPSWLSTLHEVNELNRRVFQRVHSQALEGQGVAIGLTENYRLTSYGEPVVALKSYVLSPFADEARMKSLAAHVLAAKRALSEKA